MPTIVPVDIGVYLNAVHFVTFQQFNINVYTRCQQKTYHDVTSVSYIIQVE